MGIVVLDRIGWEKSNRSDFIIFGGQLVGQLNIVDFDLTGARRSRHQKITENLPLNWEGLN